jgi:hypothetical protein
MDFSAYWTAKPIGAEIAESVFILPILGKPPRRVPLSAIGSTAQSMSALETSEGGSECCAELSLSRSLWSCFQSLDFF